VALDKLLSKTPTSAKAFQSSLHQLVSRQEQALSQTTAITPPPRLRAEQQQAVSAMQFRLGGLKGLAIGFKEALANPKETDWNTQLSLQADGLITSDVIWRNYFVTPVNAQVVRDGDTTGSAPDSIFVANANVTAPAAMGTMLAKLSGHAASSSSSVLQLGSTGPAVTAWQTQLNKWIATQSGISKVTVSGNFDSATQTATEAFQTAASITVDGIVGPETKAAMTSTLGQSGG
jgi:hypothetical protein